MVKHPNRVKFKFGHTCSGADLHAKSVTFKQQDSGELSKQRFDLLIGADGQNSRVRDLLEDQVPGFTVDRASSGRAFQPFVDLPATDKLEPPEWRQAEQLSSSSGTGAGLGTQAQAAVSGGAASHHSSSSRSITSSELEPETSGAPVATAAPVDTSSHSLQGYDSDGAAIGGGGRSLFLWTSRVRGYTLSMNRRPDGTFAGNLTAAQELLDELDTVDKAVALIRKAFVGVPEEFVERIADQVRTALATISCRCVRYVCMPVLVQAVP